MSLFDQMMSLYEIRTNSDYNRALQEVMQKMTEREKYLLCIEEHGGFVADCNRAIFSAEEPAFLKRYGHGLKALTS